MSAKKKTSPEYPQWLIDAAKQSGKDPITFLRGLVNYAEAIQSADKGFDRALEIQENKLASRTKTKQLAPYWWVIDYLSVEHRKLSCEAVQKAVSEACCNDDQAFFRALGRRLTRKRISIRDLAPAKLHLFLCRYWEFLPGKRPGLCWFTDDAITDMYHAFNPHRSDEISPENVRDARRTLRLKKVKTLKVSDVHTEKDCIVVNYNR